MSGFQAVNVPTALQDTPVGIPDDKTPTTPRPSRFHPSSQTDIQDRQEDESLVKTPTRDSFIGTIAQQVAPATPRAVLPPDTTFEPGSAPAKSELNQRQTSHRSTVSLDSAVEMDVDDEDLQNGESDNDSDGSESRPTKKKKGQKFFCTEFPPCNLSFTRSEHLARHIRKHTGERPFQCHCSRRFSRLDNLRQHAQTVHVNEDIPGDSLAATGTRFQRQIRTDRVRPTSSRSRASTLGSGGTHSRGHSRNLSTSSIASTASAFSTISQHDEFRHRPVQLSMTSTPSADASSRHRLSLDTFNPQIMGGSPGPTLYNQNDTRNQSGYHTPPSATTYSSRNASPRFSTVQSPLLTAASRVAFPSLPAQQARRLSVPSSAAVNPFQPSIVPSSQHHSGYGPMPQPSSGQSSNYAPPHQVAPAGLEGRHDSNADADWRRRTWHPSVYTGISQPRPATSGLSYHQTPDAPIPTQSSTQPAQAFRLPGIESFDHAPPVSSVHREAAEPMQVDSPARGSVDLQSGIRRLEIVNHDHSHSHSRPNSGHFSSITHYAGQTPQLPSLKETSPNGLVSQSRPPPIDHQQYPLPVLPQGRQGDANQSIQYMPAEPLQKQASMQPPLAAMQSSPMTPRNNKRYSWEQNSVSDTTSSSQGTNRPMFSQYLNYPSIHGQSAPNNVPSASFTTPRIISEDSGSSEGIPTPASSNASEWTPNAMRNFNAGGSQTSLPSTPAKTGDVLRPSPGHPYTTDRPDISNWSLQGAQRESKKREREELARPNAALRDSGVDLGQYGMAIGRGADMQRLEALAAIATGEQRA